jgi:hypothetical protein
MSPSDPSSVLEYWQSDSFVVRQTRAENPRPEAAAEQPFWGDDGFGFADLLDMLNPLQHIPLVSDIYRDVSGDEASEGARLLGGLIYGAVGGGLAGVAGALANGALRHETDEDVWGHMRDLVQGDAAAQTRPEPVVATLDRLAQAQPEAMPGGALDDEKAAVLRALLQEARLAEPQQPATVAALGPEPAPPRAARRYLDDNLLDLIGDWGDA